MLKNDTQLALETVDSSLDVLEELVTSVESLDDIYQCLNSNSGVGVNLETIRLADVAISQTLSRIGEELDLKPSIEHITEHGNSECSLQMTLESVLDSIANIFRRIKNWIGRIKDNIVSLFGVFRSRVDKLQSKLNNVKKYLDNSGDNPSSEVRIDMSAMNMLSNKGYCASDPKNVNEASNLVGSYVSMFQDYEKYIDKFIKEYIKDLNKDLDANRKSKGKYYYFNFLNRLTLFKHKENIEMPGDKQAVRYSSGVFPGGYWFYVHDYTGKYAYYPVWQFGEMRAPGQNAKKNITKVISKKEIAKLLHDVEVGIKEYRNSLDKNQRYLFSLLAETEMALKKVSDKDQNADVRGAHRQTVATHQRLLRNQKDAFAIFLNYSLRFQNALLTYCKAQALAYH